MAGYSTTGTGPDEVQSWGYVLETGTGDPDIGSISPTTDVNGYTVFGAYSTMTNTDTEPAQKYYVLIIESSTELGQSYINTVNLGGTNLSASAATYTWDSTYGLNEWVWSESIITEFVDGDSYAVSYT